MSLEDFTGDDDDEDQYLDPDVREELSKDQPDGRADSWRRAEPNEDACFFNSQEREVEGIEETVLEISGESLSGDRGVIRSDSYVNLSGLN